MTAGAFDFTILTTKLNLPGPNRNWVQRPRLLAQLNEACDKSVTLISATAGYGKTTLAAQWLYQMPGKSAWLSLEPADNAPDRFLRYLLAALCTAAEGACPKLASLLSAMDLPPVQYLAEVLIYDLTRLEAPVVLVLDDFHAITSPVISGLFERIIPLLPEKLHLCVLTRKDPLWPLALWRLRHWLREFRADELRFSLEEAQTFFARLPGGPPSADTVELLRSQTEGWAASLQVAQLCLAEEAHPEQLARCFSDGDHRIVDLMMDEVISRHPTDVQNFLALTALFDRFCAPLCDFVLAGEGEVEDSAARIARLEAENLFLVALDSERKWHRYHPLFRSFLQRHFRVFLDPERKGRMLRLAGQWFAGQGLVEESLRYFLAAGDPDSAAELVEENMDQAISLDLTRRSLGRWLDLFPPAAKEGRPALLVAQAYMKIFNWDVAGMVPLLDKAENLLRGPSPAVRGTRQRRLLAAIAGQRAFHTYWQGGVAGALRYALRALRLASGEHGYVNQLATFYASMSYAASGRLDKALQMLAEALSADCALGGRNTFILLGTQSVIHYSAGNLSTAEETARQMLALPEDTPLPALGYAHAHYLLGCTAYERNHLASAARHFGRVEEMRYPINTRLYQDALFGLALAAQAGGLATLARGYAERARDFAREVNDPYSLEMAVSFNNRLNLMVGQVPEYMPDHIPGPDGNIYWLEIPSLTKAEFLIRRDAPAGPEAALQCLETALKEAGRHHNTRHVIQFLAVKALALRVAGQSNEALKTLQAALELARPLGFVRSFLDRGRPMDRLLESLADKHPGNRYAQSLLDAWKDKPPREDLRLALAGGAEVSQPPEELSNREMDVLAMLKERLTNKEIAARLFISPTTVKKHTVNIYRKLGVHGRRQAAAAAKRLGLLDL